MVRNIDILNRLEQKSNDFAATPSTYLLAHIFPRQHGLKNVFEDVTDSNFIPVNRLTRDSEILVSISSDLILYSKNVSSNVNLKHPKDLKN